VNNNDKDSLHQHIGCNKRIVLVYVYRVYYVDVCIICVKDEEGPQIDNLDEFMKTMKRTGSTSP